jgi:hypothetical protein
MPLPALDGNFRLQSERFKDKVAGYSDAIIRVALWSLLAPFRGLGEFDPVPPAS